MTGILGYKAYRCLDSSRLVLAILVVLRVTMIVLMSVSLSRLKVSRRLSGRWFVTTPSFASEQLRRELHAPARHSYHALPRNIANGRVGFYLWVL